VELTHRTATLALAEPFTISRETTTETEVVWVELRQGEVVGYGEATPVDRYGETAASASAFLDEVAEKFAKNGDDPFELERIGRLLATTWEGEMAAKAAIDAALHDLCGKIVGLPVWRFLGLDWGGPPTSWTIWLGDPDDMARRAERADPRFRRLKLKLGGRDGLDVDRVKAVSAVTDRPLMVDVNEYWEPDEALANIEALSELGRVEYVEQPLPAGHPEGPNLKRESRLPIFVDEDCHTLADVRDCAERAHGINIKLAKSGGIREAVKMAASARSLGLGVMLGCMLESGLGIAPAAHIASLCDYVDLDGNLLLAEDPWEGVEFWEGTQIPSREPGLGVWEAVTRPR
jgi:L-alanine-DL-glutamate epimerase-like enolase superfamily enzyme